MGNANKFQPFNAAAASADYDAPAGSLFGMSTCLFQIVPAGFSGTIDFQGKLDPSASSFYTVPYVVISAAGPYAASITQLSYTTSSAVVAYLIPFCPPVLRVHMTRSAGTITLYGYTIEDSGSLDVA